MKDNSWKKIWQSDAIESEIKQIDREKAYTETFELIFKRGDKILEAGSGLGRYCYYLEKKGMDCYGVEIDKNAVDRSKGYILKNKLKSKIIQGDVTNLPYKDGFFNGYISLGVIEHFYKTGQIEQVFRESHRVLKKKGYAFFSVPNPYSFTFWGPKIMGKEKVFHRKIFMKDLKKFALDAGFKIISLKYRDFVHPFYVASIYFSKKDTDEKYRKYHKILGKMEENRILNFLCSGIHMVVQK